MRRASPFCCELPSWSPELRADRRCTLPAGASSLTRRVLSKDVVDPERVPLASAAESTLPRVDLGPCQRSAHRG
eukprot:953498-Pyramimonas_sp.AAC.1